MNTKRCFKCLKDLGFSHFYKHKMMSDGLLGKCKECAKADVVANRLDRLSYYRGYDKVRGKTPERKLTLADKQRRKRKEMGGSYDLAHRKVAIAIRGGKLIRPDHCNSCLISCVPQGHHDDHEKPLEVMWLCPICHAARHSELGRLRGSPAATDPF